MMNAKEMKQIAFDARTQKTLEKIAKTNKYVEEKILPQMEIHARIGEMGIKFHYDAYISPSYAVARLIAFGYDAKVKGNTIIISWENAGE